MCTILSKVAPTGLFSRFIQKIISLFFLSKFAKSQSLLILLPMIFHEVLYLNLDLIMSSSLTRVISKLPLSSHFRYRGANFGSNLYLHNDILFSSDDFNSLGILAISSSTSRPPFLNDQPIT